MEYVFVCVLFFCSMINRVYKQKGTEIGWTIYFRQMNIHRGTQ